MISGPWNEPATVGPIATSASADIEGYGRDLEARGRARSTIARRLLVTVAGFYRYAVEEELLEHSPAAHVRRARLDHESHAAALDRNEVGALLVAAGLGSERGHRTLTILRKGGKIVTIALAPRTARAIDLAVGERLDGPIFLRPDGQRMDRHAAGRIVTRVTRRAGLEKKISPHTLRHSTVICRPGRRRPAARRARSRLARRPTHHPMRCDRARVSLDRHATYIVAAYLAGAAR